MEQGRDVYGLKQSSQFNGRNNNTLMWYWKRFKQEVNGKDHGECIKTFKWMRGNQSQHYYMEYFGFGKTMMVGLKLYSRGNRDNRVTQLGRRNINL